MRSYKEKILKEAKKMLAVNLLVMNALVNLPFALSLPKCVVLMLFDRTLRAIEVEGLSLGNFTVRKNDVHHYIINLNQHFKERNL